MRRRKKEIIIVAKILSDYKYYYFINFLKFWKTRGKAKFTRVPPPWIN